MAQITSWGMTGTISNSWAPLSFGCFFSLDTPDSAGFPFPGSVQPEASGTSFEMCLCRGSVVDRVRESENEQTSVSRQLKFLSELIGHVKQFYFYIN